MEPMHYDDHEGDSELADSMRETERHGGRAADHAAEAFDPDSDASIADRLHSAGAALGEVSEATHDMGNGFSESLESHFEGDGTVLGEAGEAAAAIAGEVVEGTAETGMALVGAVAALGGEILDGFGDGAEDLSLGWDDLSDGDVVGAATHAGEAAKDIGQGVADGLTAGGELAWGAGVEAVERTLSVGAEAVEGVVEVGAAIGDAWDSLWGDDEPEEQEEDSEELEDEYAG